MSADRLPQIEGFDFEYAMDIFQSEEILKVILVEFYNSLDELCEKLNGLFASIHDGDNLLLYRLEVHALKSTSASVGALQISEQAKRLEMAADEKDMEVIRTYHPMLIENIERHKERLAKNMPY